MFVKISVTIIATITLITISGAPGGICQKRQAVGGYNRNLNTAIVSLINFGRYVGHAVSFITVAHELGHNFGSSVSYRWTEIQIHKIES